MPNIFFCSGHHIGHKNILTFLRNDGVTPLRLFSSLEEIYGVRVFSPERIICSHIPLHPDSMERWKLNVHGHLHANKIGTQKYLNVSMEQINYTPISMEEVMTHVYTI